MARYRKKPVVIEAEQWVAPNPDDPASLQEDHLMVLYGGEDEVGPFGRINTLEGRMRVRPGDWIITGVAGEHYPIKDEIFQQTYEPA